MGSSWLAYQKVDNSTANRQDMKWFLLYEWQRVPAKVIEQRHYILWLYACFDSDNVDLNMFTPMCLTVTVTRTTSALGECNFCFTTFQITTLININVLNMQQRLYARILYSKQRYSDPGMPRDVTLHRKLRRLPISNWLRMNCSCNSSSQGSWFINTYSSQVLQFVM